jgi:hypothetical protein
MTIPRQKIEREWKDPDESPGFGVGIYFSYFDARFFFLVVAMYFFIRFVTQTPITLVGIIIMLFTSIILSPLLNICFQQITKR